MIYNEDATNDKKLDLSATSITLVDEEVSEKRMTGEVIDTLIYSDGRREQIRPMDFNLVVDSCSKLIACLIKGQSGYSGATYWAVGSGSGSWNDASPPSPSSADAQLLVETMRKQIQPANIVFLDASNVVTATPTNKIQITVTFLEAEANGALREFAIFGGNATATLNSGIIINRKIHPIIWKTSGMKLERMLRFTF